MHYITTIASGSIAALNAPVDNLTLLLTFLDPHKPRERQLPFTSFVNYSINHFVPDYSVRITIQFFVAVENCPQSNHYKVDTANQQNQDCVRKDAFRKGAFSISGN
jgi:hypothetical protein